jgi:5-oxoprolinase (ATP-hydrolysing)
VRRLLGAGPFPSRAIEDNLSDLRAAVAANHAGVQALSQLSSEHGPETVRHYMAQLTSLAEKGLRQALRSLPCRRYEALERLDDGSPLRVQVLVQEDRATIDFTGSADVHAGNLNATPAIVNSAVIYTLRLLLRDPLPLNEGLMRAVSLRIPRGILNPGFEADLGSAPAITGGNVETSQRLVDTLLKAFGLAACSQGTMNNVIFGTERFGYYETLGGGSGAGPGFHGASAVHTHMTNTRITDPEVIEIRYPVRVERFALRLGSGGAGRYRGGDGVVRQLLFLERMTLSILSQHRTVSPYGLEGGAPGQPGAQWIIRASGEILDLGSIDGCEVRTGDRLHIETPGGGGYGSPPDPAEGEGPV